MSEEARAASSELSAEDAERMAAEFRPAWELEEAPFVAPAAPMTESTVDALANTQPQQANSAAVAQARAAAAAPDAFVAPPPPRAPTFDAPPAPPPAAPSGPKMHKTLMGMASPIGVPVSPNGAPPPPNPMNTTTVGMSSTIMMGTSPMGAGAMGAATLVSGSQSIPQEFPEPERPIIRSERPPAIDVGVSARSQQRPPPRPANIRPIVDATPNADRTGDFAVPRKSSLGMIAGIVAGALAIIGVIIAVKFATDTPHAATQPSMSGSTPSGTTTSAAQARKDDIPPPPAKDEAPPETVTKPPVLSQDIPVMKPASLPPAQPTHQSVAIASPPPRAQPQPPPRTTYQAPPPATAAKPPPGKGQNGGGIVRDAPF